MQQCQEIRKKYRDNNLELNRHNQGDQELKGAVDVPLARASPSAAASPSGGRASGEEELWSSVQFKKNQFLFQEKRMKKRAVKRYEERFT